MKFKEKLPQFFAAFLEAALWSPSGDDGAQLDTKFTPDDIDDDTKATLLAHCHSFLSRAFPYIKAEKRDGEILTALAHHYPSEIILEPNDEGKLVA